MVIESVKLLVKKPIDVFDNIFKEVYDPDLVNNAYKVYGAPGSLERGFSVDFNVVTEPVDGIDLQEDFA